MAVRTDQVGVKNKRRVGVGRAQPSMGTSEAAALRRSKSESKMQMGPASKATEYARGRIPETVNGRKKAPSQMKLKRKGGPFKHTRLHGG